MTHSANPTDSIRDSIYIDWERIRCIASQVLDSSHPLSQSLMHRSDTETLSLQQQVAVQVEEALLGQGSARIVENDFDFEQEWTLENFRDGEFVVTAGTFRLLDFQTSSKFLEATPDLMKAAFHMANLPKQEKASKDHVARRELEQDKADQIRQINEVKGLKSEQFSHSIKELYGDLVRLKVRPNDDHPANLFVGSCSRRNFIDPPAVLLERYGYQVKAGWKVLGQVNFVAEAPNLMAMPTGNSVLDTFESMAMHFNSLMRLASAPSFPAVSITPLVIYRELKTA